MQADYAYYNLSGNNIRLCLRLVCVVCVLLVCSGDVEVKITKIAVVLNVQLLVNGSCSSRRQLKVPRPRNQFNKRNSRNKEQKVGVSQVIPR